MCGIAIYVGKNNATPILLEALKRLEYRGYDSAGILVIDKTGNYNCCKMRGRIFDLEEEMKKNKIKGVAGIAHTRWATHGVPSNTNAHPHSDCNQRIWVVHNGIIENYKFLKNQLIKEGHKFISDTDTEVIPHLIEKYLKNPEDNATISLEIAVKKALADISGTYGLAVASADDPYKIVVARKSSPLVIGLGKGEYFVASDASALIGYSREIIYLDDGEMAVLTPEGFRIESSVNGNILKTAEKLEADTEKIRKGKFAHFMLKEIYEQPEAIENSLRGRLIPEEGLVKLGGLEAAADNIRNINRLLIISCGTASYAGLVGEYMIEEYAGIPVEAEVGSEFRYRKPVIDKNTAALFISQSGETADTLAALKETKQKGILSLGIVNVVGSSVARGTDAGVYNHIGPEIAVASTKAFVSQLAILALLTIFLGRQRQMSLVTGKRIGEELQAIPDKIREVLAQNQKIKEIAFKYAEAGNMYCLGRKYNFPIAREGALKIKELSYINCEGYAMGEMKHGPIALIDENFPSICIVPKDSVYEKMISNIEEIKARKGKVIAIATKGDDDIGLLADDVIYIPKTLEMLTPILSVVPLQLLAYYLAMKRGCDIDRPRNLAKSVTVE